VIDVTPEPAEDGAHDAETAKLDVVAGAEMVYPAPLITILFEAKVKQVPFVAETFPDRV
jgi:hypothetical protein